MDCMEWMAGLPSNVYDLAIIDPPYNINKAKWDKWEKNDEYIKFIIEFFLNLQRVMKENSSIYFFHNDFNQLAKIQVEIENKTNFILRQFIVWNKRFEGSKYKGYLDGFVAEESLRNYQKMAEYICFYTFQDETGLSKIMGSCVYPVREYIRQEIIKAKGKIILKEINNVLETADNGGGVASAVLSINKKTPAFITKGNYEKLRVWLNNGKEYEYLRKEYEYLRKEYEDLRKEYEYLRKEYEDLRYYFNNRKIHHSVWNYDFIPSWHPTPKPKYLIHNILLHSLRPGGKVFNPFNGSENIRVVCHDMKVDFEGCEIDPDYWQEQENRYLDYISQGNLFDTEEIQNLTYKEKENFNDKPR